jgi:hypothetical protein
LWLSLGLVVAAYGGTVLALVAGAARDADRGRHQIELARGRAGISDLVAGAPIPRLRAARAAFDRAHAKVTNPLLAPLAPLPVVGRQLRSLRALSRSARDVADIGAGAAAEARRALARPHAAGPQRVALVDAIHRLVSSASARLSSVDLGPRRALVPPLRKAYDELSTQLTDVRATLSSASAATDGVSALLTGPRRYLVFAANNAEMRAGSGMLLSVGLLEAREGRIELGDMVPVEDALPPPGSAPPIGDADLARLWGWKAPNEDYRQLLLSPRFPASAALAARMWIAAGHPPVDGVLVLDPVAVRAVLAATGPVVADGRTITSETVVGELLKDQYRRFGADVSSRREELGVIARAVFDAVDRGDLSISTLGSELVEAVAGRHLMIWSSRSAEQRAWERGGVAGTLRPDSVLLAVDNRGCNKMDPHLEARADLTLRRGRRSTSARLVVRLANTTPPGLPRYVTGNCPNGLAARQYLGILAVTLPGSAAAITLDGKARFTAAGRDGPTIAIAEGFVLDAGDERRFVIRFRLPPEHRSVRVEPGARVPATRWTSGTTSWRDTAARIVRF